MCPCESSDGWCGRVVNSVGLSLEYKHTQFVAVE